MNEGWNDISVEGNDVFIEGNGVFISQDFNPIRMSTETFIEGYGYFGLIEGWDL